MTLSAVSSQTSPMRVKAATDQLDSKRVTAWKPSLACWARFASSSSRWPLSFSRSSGHANANERRFFW